MTNDKDWNPIWVLMFFLVVAMLAFVYPIHERVTHNPSIPVILLLNTGEAHLDMLSCLEKNGEIYNQYIYSNCTKIDFDEKQLSRLNYTQSCIRFNIQIIMQGEIGYPFLGPQGVDYSCNKVGVTATYVYCERIVRY